MCQKLCPSGQRDIPSPETDETTFAAVLGPITAATATIEDARDEQIATRFNPNLVHATETRFRASIDRPTDRRITANPDVDVTALRSTPHHVDCPSHYERPTRVKFDRSAKMPVAMCGKASPRGNGDVSRDPDQHTGDFTAFHGATTLGKHAGLNPQIPFLRLDVYVTAGTSSTVSDQVDGTRQELHPVPRPDPEFSRISSGTAAGDSAHNNVFARFQRDVTARLARNIDNGPKVDVTAGTEVDSQTTRHQFTGFSPSADLTSSTSNNVATCFHTNSASGDVCGIQSRIRSKPPRNIDAPGRGDLNQSRILSRGYIDTCAGCAVFLDADIAAGIDDDRAPLIGRWAGPRAAAIDICGRRCGCGQNQIAGQQRDSTRTNRQHGGRSERYVSAAEVERATACDRVLLADRAIACRRTVRFLVDDVVCGTGGQRNCAMPRHPQEDNYHRGDQKKAHRPSPVSAPLKRKNLCNEDRARGSFSETPRLTECHGTERPSFPDFYSICNSSTINPTTGSVFLQNTLKADLRSLSGVTVATTILVAGIVVAGKRWSTASSHPLGSSKAVDGHHQCRLCFGDTRPLDFCHSWGSESEFTGSEDLRSSDLISLQNK